MTYVFPQQTAIPASFCNGCSCTYPCQPVRYSVSFVPAGPTPEERLADAIERLIPLVEQLVQAQERPEQP